MRQIELRIVALTGAMAMLLTLVGCGAKDDLSSQKTGKQSVTAPQPGLEDSRIPPARKAEIEAIIARQKSGADEIGAKRQAAANQAASMKRP
ncbi:MAG: hypothetical protein H8F28_07680 [Fibrella sp.]|nr:hypothetical protein [Armatimonadota bacterium]